MLTALSARLQMTTASEVAAWMLEQIKTKKELYQDEAFHEIERSFGKSFAYQNDVGSNVISPSVLKRFNQISKDDVVWSRSYKHWRLREQGDEPGRMQH